jgi:hypothetical protein
LANEPPVAIRFANLLPNIQLSNRFANLPTPTLSAGAIAFNPLCEHAWRTFQPSQPSTFQPSTNREKGSSMATIEITVTKSKTGRRLAHEIYQMEPELARQFMQQLEGMLAGFERPVRVTKSFRDDGVAVLEIVAGPELLKPPPAVTGPTFEQQYRRPLLPAPRQEANDES